MRYIGEFFRRAHELGTFDVTRCGAAWPSGLRRPQPDHWLLVDPDPELRQILLTELRGCDEARGARLLDRRVQRRDAGSRSIVCCRPSQERAVRAVVPAGIELVVLPITSANQWLLPWMPAPQGAAGRRGLALAGVSRQSAHDACCGGHVLRRR